MSNSTDSMGAYGALAFSEVPRNAAPAGLVEGRHLLRDGFIMLAFLVLQGAFIAMSVADDSVQKLAAGDESDPRHVVAFAAVLFGTILFALPQWRRLLAVVRANPGYFILPVLLVLSVLWSIDPLLTLKRSLLTAGICVFDLYVAASLGLDRILRLMSLTIAVVALASLVAALAVPSIGREVGAGLAGDWRGVFSQKNAFGHIMSVGVFIEMALMLRARRLLAGACLRAILCTFLVVMANSESSLLAVVLTLLFSAGYAARQRGPATLLICGLMAFGVLLIGGVIVAGDFSGLLKLADRDTSLTGRTDLWDYVIDAIGERPLAGWGYAAFWGPDSVGATYILNQIRWSAPNAHNGYLELTLGLGLVGLTGFLAMALWTLRRIATLLLQRQDLGALLLIISAQLLAVNLTESFIVSASVFGWNVYSIIALKSGIALHGRRGERSEVEEVEEEAVLIPL
jgi:O-antigen ligase